MSDDELGIFRDQWIENEGDLERGETVSIEIIDRDR